MKTYTIPMLGEVQLVARDSLNLDRGENIVCQAIFNLKQSDYVEIFVENDTDADDVTVSDLNVIIEALN